MKFSICIATHRVDQRLKNTLFSLKSLDYPRSDFEICLFVNGNFDTTQLHQLQVDRLKLVPRAVGPGAAKNSAIELASNDWAILLDSDDFLVPSALKVYKQAIENYPEMEIGFEYSAINFFSGPQKFSIPPNEAEFEKYFEHQIARINMSGACGHALLVNKKSEFRFDPEFKFMEERDLAIRIWKAKKRPALLKTCTYAYNWNETGATGGLPVQNMLTLENKKYHQSILDRMRGIDAEVVAVDTQFRLTKPDFIFLLRMFELERLTRGDT